MPFPFLNSSLTRLLRSLGVGHQRDPVYQPTSWQPMVRALEPRLVLNASAGLNPLGQLLISGTNASDFVQLSVNADNELTLRDQVGNVIPIANHPDGTGFETNPLALAAITSKRIHINLDEGDDSVVTELISGFDVIVAASDGNDSATLKSNDSITSDLGRLRVDSENIELSASGATFRFGNIVSSLVGDVTIENPLSTRLVEIDAPLAINGSLTLENDLTIRGDGSLDLSQATLSASQPSVDFRITLPQGEIRLGDVNDAGGNAIDNFTIASASSVRLQGDEVSVSDQFIIRNVATSLQVDSTVHADSVLLSAQQQITVFGEIQAVETVSIESDLVVLGGDVDSINGDILVQSSDQLRITSDALLSTGDTGRIRFDGGGGSIDATNGRLMDLGTGQSITIINASDVSLGMTTATDGTITLGTIASPVGSVQQSAGSSVSVGKIQGVINGNLTLGEANNSFESAGDLTVQGNVDLNDASSDLFIKSLIVAGGQVNIAAVGVVSLGRLEASDANVRIEASKIIDASDDRIADVIANRLDLDAQTGTSRSEGIEVDGIVELRPRVTQGDTFIESLGGEALDLVSIRAENGSFELTAAGNIDVSSVEVTNGNASLTTSGAIRVGALSADNGEVTLSGATIDDANNDNTPDVSAKTITLSALLGIGNQQTLEIDQASTLTATTVAGDLRIDSLGSDSLEVTASNSSNGLIEISAAGDLFARQIQSASGSVTLESLENLLIGTIDASDGVVDLDGNTINDATVDQIADVIASQINFGATNGIGNEQTIEIDQAELLTATTLAGDVRIESLGAESLIISEGTTGAGSVVIQTLGDVRADRLVAMNGNVILNSGGAIAVLSIEATTGTIELTGVSINDAQVDSIADLTAISVLLKADEGIGNDQTIEIDQAELFNATTLAGDVRIESLGAESLIITEGTTGAGSVVIETLSDVRVDRLVAVDGDVNLNSDGAIAVGSIEATTGTVELTGLSINDAQVDSVADLTAINVVLTADEGIGNKQTLEIDQMERLTATSLAGDVRIESLGAESLIITEGSSGAGSVVIETLGDVRADRLVAVDGDVKLNSDGAIAVGSIEATTGTIELTGLSINDAQVDSIADLTAINVVLTADQGIGNDQIIELDQVRFLISTNTSGDINLRSLGDETLTLTEVATSAGSIDLQAIGSVIAELVTLGQTDTTGTNTTDPCSTGTSNVDDFGIQIRLTGLGSDLLVGNVSAFGDADVALSVADDIRHIDEGDVAQRIVADDLNLRAGNDSADANSGILLRSTINELVATIEGPHPGDLTIVETDSLCLASSDQRVDSIVETKNGQINISAGHTIHVVDHDADEQNGNLKGDPEIIANGEDNGSVFFSAPKVILGDNVQIHGFRDVMSLSAATTREALDEPTFDSPDRAISIKTNELVIGSDIELFTGDQQGTARQFTQRPVDASQAGFAFFDPNTVRVNVLTQALQNDATGILTFDIGTQGERGMTVIVDWGDSNGRRFQQLDGLSADEGYFVDIAPDAGGTPLNPFVTSSSNGQLQLNHLYLQEDVLNSQENGRNAATSPFNVRFAVRHHESIVVQSLNEEQSATVVQNGVSNTAAGGLLSGTDNPTTQLQLDVGTRPQLESGTAAFIIPALTIPQAFIPVRDVIPEFETPEVIIVSETSVELTSSSVEAVESPTSGTVFQEEYLQLRVLSPDPDGEDLAPPQKLPKDILNGDQLTELLERLPDGAYEIEYVISEGDERSILRVNVRDGEATIPDSELDEGLLRLQEIHDSADESNREEQPDRPAADADDQVNVSTEARGVVVYEKNSGKALLARWSSADRFARRRDG